MADGENSGTAPDMTSVQADVMRELGLLLDGNSGQKEASA
jgi:hypothetical protein